MKYPVETLEKALKVKVDGVTLKKYLENLLVTLWDEGEGFSGKRPFGNSGWDMDIIAALVKKGLVQGTIDDCGYVEDYDEAEGIDLVFQIIKYQMGK